MQQVLDVSNDVAAELAAIGDGVLDALRDRPALHDPAPRQPTDDRG
jgi:hypothetical protein